MVLGTDLIPSLPHKKGVLLQALCWRVFGGSREFGTSRRQLSDKTTLFVYLGETHRSEFDHRAARNRDIAGDSRRAALGQMERRVLFVIGVLARRAVAWNDDLVAALRRARSRTDGRPLERVAADDHGLDAGLPESWLESRAHEFVRPGLTIPFAGARLDRGVHYVVGCRLAIRANEAVPDHHVVRSRFIMQPFQVRHRCDVTRARGAVSFHYIEKQKRCGRTIGCDLLELRHRRCTRTVP